MRLFPAGDVTSTVRLKAFHCAYIDHTFLLPCSEAGHPGWFRLSDVVNRAAAEAGHMVGLVWVFLKPCYALAVQKVAVWRRLPLPGSPKPSSDFLCSFFPSAFLFGSLLSFPSLVASPCLQICGVVRGVCVLCPLTVVQLVPCSLGPEPWASAWS